VEYSSAIRLQAFARTLLAQRAVSRMATTRGGKVSDEWEVSDWSTTTDTFNALGFTFQGGPTKAQQERATMLAQVHTVAIETLRTEFTAAAAILLRFARHRCLHSQYRSDTRDTIKAKQLIQRLTTGLKGERESISDQLAMAMQAEREAQDVDEETGIWEYTPCYLVK
jgi:hypothetical protein